MSIAEAAPRAGGRCRSYHDPQIGQVIDNGNHFTFSGNQAVGSSLRLHQRVDYSSSILTQQLYQQDFYQASNATRTIEAGTYALEHSRDRRA